MKNEDGHPCSKDCCDNPQTFTPDHDEPEDPDEFCEDCYGLECESCGEVCLCDL